MMDRRVSSCYTGLTVSQGCDILAVRLFDAKTQRRKGKPLIFLCAFASLRRRNRSLFIAHRRFHGGDNCVGDSLLVELVELAG